MAFYDTSSTTWSVWTSGMSSTASTSSVLWRSWATRNATATTSTTSNSIYRIWVASTGETMVGTELAWKEWTAFNAGDGYDRVVHVQKEVVSEEERQRIEEERIRRAEEQRIACENREAEQKAAEELANGRAEELLRSTLTLRQRRSYKKRKAFVVHARDGTRFRLKKGWAGNIEELDKRGRPINRFCIHPSVAVPHADNLVAQKLLLETDPDKFRKIANRIAIGLAA